MKSWKTWRIFCTSWIYPKTWRIFCTSWQSGILSSGTVCRVPNIASLALFIGKQKKLSILYLFLCNQDSFFAIFLYKNIWSSVISYFYFIFEELSFLKHNVGFNPRTMINRKLQIAKRDGVMLSCLILGVLFAR